MVSTSVIISGLFRASIGASIYEKPYTAKLGVQVKYKYSQKIAKDREG